MKKQSDWERARLIGGALGDDRLAIIDRELSRGCERLIVECDEYKAGHVAQWGPLGRLIAAVDVLRVVREARGHPAPYSMMRDCRALWLAYESARAKATQGGPPPTPERGGAPWGDSTGYFAGADEWARGVGGVRMKQGGDCV